MVKINRNQMNHLLKCISKDNTEYGLIFILCYVYGRLVSEVYLLHNNDVDFKENKITFTINDEKVEYPLYEPLVDDLKRQCNETNEFLFKHIGKNTHNFSNKLNYQLKKYDHVYDVHVAPRDFKKLRGQHLILDGVPIEIVQKLFHSSNISTTKNFLDYDKLLGIKKVESLELIFNDYTDIN